MSSRPSGKRIAFIEGRIDAIFVEVEGDIGSGGAPDVKGGALGGRHNAPLNGIWWEVVIGKVGMVVEFKEAKGHLVGGSAVVDGYREVMRELADRLL